jgi:dihydrolipoamide dehydrogenase
MEPSKVVTVRKKKYDVVFCGDRRPYTAGLKPETSVFRLDKLGRIEVDEHFRTKVPSIYAIGDCIDGPTLAHKAKKVQAVETMVGLPGTSITTLFQVMCKAHCCI